MVHSKVPALVISGFLGSGKTTLVRELLDAARRDGVRVALISNELGELGIDRALLGAGDEAFVELEGGCVCCELSDDLVNTLQMLWERVQPQRVIVETSGVALPFDTQLNFWREPICAWIGDDLAVVVVNAEQLAEGRDLEGTFQDQVSSADLLVLNKIDLVPAQQLAEVEARLREIEPEAPIVRCSRGRADPALFFVPDLGTVDRSAPAPATRPHAHDQFHSWEIQVDAGIDPQALERRLAQPGLLRAKGFVLTSDGPTLVQVVGRRIEFELLDFDPEPSLMGRVITIWRH